MTATQDQINNNGHRQEKKKALIIGDSMVKDIRRLNINKKLKFTNVSVNCFPGTNTTFREKYPNTELILVRIFPHSD